MISVAWGITAAASATILSAKFPPAEQINQESKSVA
jgi:hypothetical protein